MSRDSTNEHIFAKLAPLRGDFSTEDIVDAIHAGREEHDSQLSEARGTVRLTDRALVLSRHLDAAGQLVAMPRKEANRWILLQHFAAAIEPGEDHEETAVNARLRQFSDDVAMLRRYLVDEGLLERRPPGIYRRTVNERPASE